MKNIQDEVQSLISTQTGQIHHARPPGGAQVFTKMQKLQTHLDLQGKTQHCAMKRGWDLEIQDSKQQRRSDYTTLYNSFGLSGLTFLTSFTALPFVLQNFWFLQNNLVLISESLHLWLPLLGTFSSKSVHSCLLYVI